MNSNVKKTVRKAVMPCLLFILSLLLTSCASIIPNKPSEQPPDYEKYTIAYNQLFLRAKDASSDELNDELSALFNLLDKDLETTYATEDDGMVPCYAMRHVYILRSYLYYRQGDMTEAIKNKKLAYFYHLQSLQTMKELFAARYEDFSIIESYLLLHERNKDIYDEAVNGAESSPEEWEAMIEKIKAGGPYEF